MNIKIGSISFQLKGYPIILQEVSMDVDQQIVNYFLGLEKITNTVKKVTVKPEKVSPEPAKITKPAKKVIPKKRKASAKKKAVKNSETNKQTKRPPTDEEQKKINQVYQKKYSLKKKGELTDEAHKELDAVLAEIEAKRTDTYQISQ
jgi:hypothetical protein